MLQKKNKSKEKIIKKKKLKKLKGNLDEDNLSKYNSVKNELDEIYNYIVEGTQIRSKCNWYKNSKKSTFFF